MFLDFLYPYSIGAQLSWSFETFRYFGPQHLEVKDTRIVTLSPKQPVYDGEYED